MQPIWHPLSKQFTQLVRSILLRQTAKTGHPPSGRRLMLNGILWMLHTGAASRDRPERFGPWQTAYDHFSRWRKEGV